MDAPTSATQFPMSDSLWYFEIIVGILVLVAVNFIFKKVVKHVRHRSISTTQDWKEKIDQVLYLPFQVLLWILGVTLVTEVLGRRLGFTFYENYIDAFRSTGFVLCAAWVLLRWKTVLQRNFLNKEHPILKVDSGFVTVSGKILSIGIIVISLMIILQIWGLNIAPLIAFGGIGAAAVGFAAKDVIANFFGGFMLYVTRPFMEGDTVTFPDRHIEGTIEDIGWYVTTLRDKEKRPVYIPNALFSNAHVINDSRMTHRRIEEKVGVRFDDFSKIPLLIENIKKAITSHADIDTHMPVLVFLGGSNQYTLEIGIDVYTLQTRYDQYIQVKHEIFLAVYEELIKAGAEMPIPMFSIYGRSSPVMS